MIIYPYLMLNNVIFNLIQVTKGPNINLNVQHYFGHSHHIKHSLNIKRVDAQTIVTVVTNSRLILTLRCRDDISLALNNRYSIVSKRLPKMLLNFPTRTSRIYATQFTYLALITFLSISLKIHLLQLYSNKMNGARLSTIFLAGAICQDSPTEMHY